MEKYFELGIDNRLGGQVCASTFAQGPEAQTAYKFTMQAHQQTFENIGAKFAQTEFETERYCAIRLAGTAFFKVRQVDGNSAFHCCNPLSCADFAGCTPSK